MANDKLKKKLLAKAQQNRQRRVENSNKKYNNTTSKSQRDYIAGDIISSASKKAYAYKKDPTYMPKGEIFTGGRSKKNYEKLQNGENPYEAKYVYTGRAQKVKGGTRKDGSTYDDFVSKKRQLTDKEKKMWKAQGSLDEKAYDSKYTYSIMSSADKNAKNFWGHLNTGKLDGIKVAKNKVRAGGSKWNYLGGLGKDLIVDPLVDVLKIGDRVESAVSGGLIGAFEESGNLVKKLAGDKNAEFDITRSFKNMKDSWKQSDSTGWGKGGSDYLGDIAKRTHEYNLRNIKSKGYSDEFEKEQIKKENERYNDKNHKMGLNVAGFGLDVINPLEIGTGIVKGLGTATKNTKKAFKEMVDGTADLSVAFKNGDDLVKVGQKHKDMLNRVSAYNKYLKEEYVPYLKKSGKRFDDVEAERMFEATTKGSNQINHALDKGFDTAMANDTKKVLKSNPNTKNLGSFLDDIGENVDSGKQIKWDARTHRELGKKGAMIKNELPPQLMRGTDDIIENNPIVDKNQLSMFNRNGNTNTYEKNIKLNSNRFEKWYNAYENEDDLFEMIDELSDSNADGMLDWLSKNDPEMYERYVGTSDIIDNMVKDANIIVDEKNILDEKSLNDLEHAYNKTDKLRDVSNIKDYQYTRVPVKKEVMKIKGLASDVRQFFNGQEALINRKNINYINKVYNKFNLDRMMKDSNIEFSKRAPYSVNKKKFLDGTKEFVDNLKNLDSNQLGDLSKTLRSLEDIPGNVRRDEVVETVNNLLFNGEKVVRGSISPKDLRNLIVHCDDLVNYKLAEALGEFSFKPRSAKNLKNGVHYMKTRNGLDNVFKSNFNKYAPTSTDDLFDEKMALVDSLVGVKNKSELSNPIEELKKLRRTLIGEGSDLSPEQYRKLQDLESRLSIRQEAYGKVKDLDHDDYYKYIEKHYGKKDAVISELDKLASQNKKVTREDFYDEAVNEVQSLIENGKIDEFLKEGGSPNDLVEELVEAKFKEYFKFEDKGYINKIEHNNRNLTIREDGTVSQSPRLEQERLNSVGEIFDNVSKEKRFEKQIESLRNELKIKKPNMNNAKIKLSKGQKLGTLPPVMENSKNLRKTIEAEVEMMYKNPKKYEEMKDAFKQIKKEYVQSMRSFGVKDESYFKKVKQVQDDLHMYFKELNKPSSLVKKSKETGQGTPKLGMNLQLLAQRIQDTFDELDDIVSKTNATEFTDDLNTISKQVDNKSLTNGSQIADDYNPFDDLKSSMPLDIEFPRDIVKNGRTAPPVKGAYRTVSESGINTKRSPLDVIQYRKDGDNIINNKTGEIIRKNGKQIADDLQTNLKQIDDKLSTNGSQITDQLPTNGSQIKNKSFDEFKKLFEKNNPHMKYEDSKVYDIYKRWLNTYKKGLTVYNPGWHVQNFFQNKGQNYIALGNEAFGSQKNARKVLDIIQGGKNNADTILNKHGKAYTGDEIAKLAQDLGVVNSQTDDVMNTRSFFPQKFEQAIDNSWLMKKAGRSEDTARLHHFMTQLQRGMSPEEASKSVNKYLYDYSNKSAVDKVMGDFIDPFWQFHSNQAKMLGKSALENPSRINKILRGERGLENGLESHEKTNENYGRFQALNKSFEDDVNYQNYDYLYAQNLFPQFQNAVPTSRDDLENKLNPILRLALQQSRGEGNFGNKLVEGDEAGWGETTLSERNKEVAYELNPILNPLFKAIDKSSDHQKLADEGKQSQETSDKQILHDWLNYILGNKANYYKRK